MVDKHLCAYNNDYLLRKAVFRSPSQHAMIVLREARAMIIVVGQISEEDGLRIHHLYPEGEPHLEETDSRIKGRPALSLTATRTGDEVRLEGKLKAEVEFDCDRCLKVLSQPIDQTFDLVYIPPLKPSGSHDEKELGNDDLSVGFYQGQALDLDDVVREQVELALPMSRVCKEDCLGLCQQCGADLNEGRCLCETSENDPRWSALRELKFDN